MDSLGVAHVSHADNDARVRLTVRLVFLLADVGNRPQTTRCKEQLTRSETAAYQIVDHSLRYRHNRYLDSGLRGVQTTVALSKRFHPALSNG